MSHQYRAPIRAQSFDHAADIADHALHIVSRDRMWLSRSAITAHVDRTGREPGLRHGPNLVPPRKPRFQEPMYHHNQRLRAFRGRANANLGQVDVFEFGHVSLGTIGYAY